MAKEILTKERCAKDMLSDLKIAKYTLLHRLPLPFLCLGISIWFIIELCKFGTDFKPIFALYWVVSYPIIMFIITGTDTIRSIICYYKWKNKIKNLDFIINKSTLLDKSIGEYQFRQKHNSLINYRATYVKQTIRHFRAIPKGWEIYYFDNSKRYIPVTLEDCVVRYAQPKEEFYTVTLNKNDKDILLVYSADSFEYT